MKILILTALTIATSMAADTSAAWNYIRSDTDVGPTAWDTNFATCAGERNSPINIKTGAAVQKAAVAWDLTGWNTNHTYTISDSHNGIKYTLDGANPITTQGGDLQNTYKLLQFHFHWGADDTKGSEHTVDGNEYPMEVHFVHWNGDYSDAGAAIASDDDDALAVLGFFFEIQDDDNEKLAGMIEDIQNVRANNYTLSDIFIENLSDSVYQSMTGNFYRYFGGLTTPGCNEIVRWTVFETPIGISASQMATIRTQPQSYLDEYGEDFFRDPVALGSRTVVKYDVNYNSAAISCLSLSLAFLSAMVKFL